MQTQQAQAPTAIHTAMVAAGAIPAPVPATAADLAKIQEDRQKQVVTLQAKGEGDAQFLIDSELKQDQSRAKFWHVRLMEAAKILDADWKIAAYIEGFRKAWPENTAKVRASEAKTIIAACQKEPEFFAKFTGRYHEMVARCRDINGRKTTGGVTRTRQPAVTDKGMATLSDKVRVLKPAQALVVANEAIAQMVATTPEGWEVALLRQIDGMCTRLGTSKQPHFQKVAEAVQKIASEELNRYAIEHAAKEEKKPEAKAA